ncbi:MAG: hypothetical protein DLM64_06070 [Solirubrobacterales bacterium]|nr:MAG: hypothetical protein DLM64_06070 [Solirubrobacterales bacterium]
MSAPSGSWAAFCRQHWLALEGGALVFLFLLAIDVLGAGKAGEPSSGQVWASAILTLALGVLVAVQAVSWMHAARRQLAGRAVMLVAVVDLGLVATVAGHANSPIVQGLVGLIFLFGVALGLAAVLGRRATRLLLILERIMLRLGGRLLLTAIIDGIKMGLGAGRVSGELGERGAANLDNSFKDADARRQDFEEQKKVQVAAIKKARGDVWHD